MSKLSLEQRHEALRAGREALGISAREERRYSLARALLTAGLEGKLTGYEGEIDQQLRAQTGKTGTTNGSILLPTAAIVLAARDMTVGTDSAGGYLVGASNPGASFIDLLRARLVAVAMGARVLPGLKGDVTIPKQAAAATAHWLVNETTSIGESNQVLGQLPLTPKNVGAYTEYSRQLLMQSSPAVDQVIANDLAKVVSAAIDAAVFAGSGANGQPAGIALTSGIGSFSGTSLGLAGLNDAVVDCALALEGEAVGWVTTPAVAAALMQRQKFAGTDTPLWEGSLWDGRVVGFKAMTSSAMAAGTMFFGDWSQVVIGEWGMLEIATNPYANFQAGIIGCRAIQTVDVGVRQAGAFSYSNNVT